MPGFRHLTLTCLIAASAVGCGVDRATNPLPATGAPTDADGDITSSSPLVIPDIQFPILPASVTIQIFSANGAVIRTIVLDLNGGSHEIAWDGLTDAGLRAGAGVYMYRIEYPDGSRSVGRLVLVR